MPSVNVQADQKEPCVWELTVEVPAHEVRRVTDSVYRQISRTLPVPGFRPGHTPPSIIKRWVGEERIHQQVLENLLPNALLEAIQQQNLTPIISPEWRNVQFAEGEPLRFVAEVITRPEVKLGEYKGLPLDRLKVVVTDEDVQRELEKLWQELAHYEPTDEPAQEHDRVRVRYQVLGEGKGSSEQWQSGTFTAGEAKWTPPLPQNLVGRKAGDEGEFTFSYPDDFSDPDLAGKTARVRFVVESVLRRQLPELTDEAVRREFKLDSVEELKEEVRYELVRQSRQTARFLSRVQAEEALLQRCLVTVPNALLERFTEELVAQTGQPLRQKGLTLELWLQRQGKTLDEYKSELRSEAERTLKLRFILEAIAEKEGIAVSDEEVQQLAQGETELDEDRLATLRRQLLEQRVMELVLATARWKDGT